MLSEFLARHGVSPLALVSSRAPQLTLPHVGLPKNVAGVKFENRMIVAQLFGVSWPCITV